MFYINNFVLKPNKILVLSANKNCLIIYQQFHGKIQLYFTHSFSPSVCSYEGESWLGQGQGKGRGRGRWHHNCTLLLFASHWEFLSFFIKRDMPLAQRKKCKSWFVYLFTNKQQYYDEFLRNRETFLLLLYFGVVCFNHFIQCLA